MFKVITRIALGGAVAAAAASLAVPTTAATAATANKPRPRVAALSQHAGSTAGGIWVVIRGTHLRHVKSVRFGAARAAKVRVIAGRLRVLAPPHASGRVNVRVRTSAGLSNAVAADRFTYRNPPSIVSIAPASSGISGGGVITVHGSGFTTAGAAVTFGTTKATTVKVLSASELTAVVPPHAAGIVDVRVRNAVASSKPTNADHFHYVQAVAIAAGTTHSCAVLAEGTVECWGDNSWGELGDGTTSWSPRPVVVKGIDNAVAATAGSQDTCTLLADQTVRCWGDNVYGELGNGSNTPSSVPVQVSGLTGVTAIAADFGNGNTQSVCAVKSDHTVWCWGRNAEGELGAGVIGGSSSTPVPVAGISHAVAISGGLHAFCALLDNGSVSCWGANNVDQLGTGQPTNQPSAVPVYPDLNGIRSVGNGGDATCAVFTSGGMRCWGYGHQGQIGNGDVQSAHTPAHVTGITTATATTSGSDHECALLTGGDAQCWGDNTYGQLGSSQPVAYSATPTPVSGLHHVAAIAARGWHTCALTSDGRVLCWGANSAGELGDGSTVGRVTPLPVALR